MSAQKNEATKADEKARAANAAKGDTAGEVDFSREESIELDRSWYQAKEGRPGVWLRLLDRSQNIRDLFPGLNNDALYAWAAEIAQPSVDPGEGIIKGGKDVAAKRGDVVFFFEPKILRDALIREAAEGHPIRFFTTGLEPHTPKKGPMQGHKLKRRVWEIKRIPQWLQSMNKGTTLLMPAGGDASLVAEMVKAADEDNAD